MLIDLHNHTKISSPCSLLSPEELIETAQRSGLDGIGVTEHAEIAGANLAQELGRKYGFPVFRGIEARSSMGDVLVYGYYHDIPNDIPLDELCRRVHEVGGVLFIAHPYRTGGKWGLYDLMAAIGLADWKPAKDLRDLDGIEVINGQFPDEMNDKARRLADRLGLPGIGGSDAHAVHMVGTAATRFEQPIHSDADLVAALKSGHYQAIRLRYLHA